jgi:hypothetical protein
MSSTFFYFMGGACPPPGLRLYDAETGFLLATEPLPGGAGAFSFDVSGLGLAAGSYSLAVTAVSVYGCESSRALMSVEVGSGGEVGGFIDAQDVVAEALAGGSVAVRWEAFAAIAEASARTTPAAYEVAESGDLSTVLDTVAWNRTGVHRSELGPYADGLSKTFAVRASDGVGGGVRGAWVYAAAVTTDAAGPDVPVIDVASLPEGCGCS